MAALSEYPKTGAVVRGDPLTIPVTITSDGAELDASLSDWRAQVRTQYDAAVVVSFTCTTAVPAGGTVASQVLMSLTGDETALLKSGMVFDLEELDQTTGDTIRTWWICTNLRIQQDVSRDDLGPLPAQAPTLVKTARRA
jgi:hypothetical protein